MTKKLHFFRTVKNSDEIIQDTVVSEPVAWKWWRRDIRVRAATRGVVILGADGSGKTTLVKAIRTQLPREISVRLLGMSDGAWHFPAVGRLYKLSLDRKKSLARNLALHFLLIPLDVLFRLSRPSGRFLVVERVPLKPLIINPVFRKLLFTLIGPKILFVVLDGDPAVFQLRRPTEETVETISDEQKKLRHLIKMLVNPDIFLIDSAKMSQAEVEQIAVEKIKEFFEGRDRSSRGA